MSQKLPKWDLSDLYSGIHDPCVAEDLAKYETLSREFARKYKGKIGKISGDELAEALRSYEAMEDLGGKLGSFAYLAYATDMSDTAVTRFYQDVMEKMNVIGTLTLFFTLEINKISDVAMKEKLKSAALRHYQPWLDAVRLYRPHQLSDAQEKLLHEKYVAGRAAWTRLFDETIADMKFKIKDKKYSMAEAFDFLSHHNPKQRKAAAESISKKLGKHAKLFALITNTLAKDKEIEDKWRKYPQPISSRNLSNRVEDEVVAALIETVRANYNRLSHRYYTMKARWLGMKHLNFWDRNAPLSDEEEATYSWEECKEIVLTAYHNFSPELAEYGKKFFENAWIDAEVRAGKAPGAFAHPTVPSAHPYLLVNFQGKQRDIMTVAHELGHGVHQMLSAKQGPLMADTPLTLAETASVFGEQLTFRELLRRTTDPAARKRLLASKVEDMLNTVVRQIAFCEFELRLHDQRRKGELTPEDIGKLWMEVQRESLGPIFKFDESYQYYWSYIPHFIHTPFYVYAYAYGDCLVNSLYAVYEKSKARGKAKDFEQKYLAMLQAGGTLHHKQLLKPFGLDACKPTFWQQGLDMLAGFIAELETMS
jgi:oligoendopeptidase F